MPSAASRRGFIGEAQQALRVGGRSATGLRAVAGFPLELPPHRILLRGREVIQWAPLASLGEATKPYDDVKDAAFFTAGVEFVPVRLATSQFAMLFPDDGHAPCCAWGEPEPVIKVVVKVAVSQPA